jgi:hypothetical protein
MCCVVKTVELLFDSKERSFSAHVLEFNLAENVAQDVTKLVYKPLSVAYLTTKITDIIDICLRNTVEPLITDTLINEHLQ